MWWVLGRLLVLATHDQVRWDLGLEFSGGGHERPDAQLGAPYTWRVFVIDEEYFCCVVLWVLREVMLKWVARKLLEGHDSNFGIAVCTVSCVYGSTDRREHSFGRKR
jgi:hypothetical protein